MHFTFDVRRSVIAAALLILSGPVLAGPSGSDLASQGLTTAIEAAAAELPISSNTIDANSDAPSGWYARVHRAQATQPNWITPLATVTPRLEEEVRYDQFWQNLGNGAKIYNYDGGKGLELIPTTTNEVILNVPPYENRFHFKKDEGWADDTLLLIKQRFASANAEYGDYIVTGFLSFVAPTGIDAFTGHAWEVTPTIAGGKGCGNLDFQATCGLTIPTSHASTLGDALATNIAFQYHLDDKYWPEFEINDTRWSGGERTGKNQVLLTPGIILGRFKLNQQMKGIVGFGYQWAVAPALVKDPITPMYSTAWITSFRVTF